MNIGIYIYENAEVLDFSGPYEVFATANRFIDSQQANQVFLIAEKMAPVMARGGYSVNPHFGFDDHPAIDVLVVVGGIHVAELDKAPVLEWVAKIAKDAQIVASVCTGAFILAKAGVIRDQTVTTHWEDIPELRASFPNLRVVKNQRWVDEGKYVTSGGISAGIDMSLHLVSRIASLYVAEKTARQMEFDWRKN